MFLRLTLLLSILFFISCRDRKPKIEANTTTSKKEVSTIIPNLKIYIEDGGSMKGFFIDPNFAFSSDLSKLFVNLDSKSKELNLITKEDIKPLKHNSDLEFSQYLSNLNKNGRYRGESSFEKMLGIVLNTSKNNTVTAFVSDYIQSSTDLTNDIAGVYISVLLSKKLRENKNFAVCVLKMKSRFKGEFYYVSKQRKDILPNPDSIDMEKPYYVWFFGDNDMIEKLNLNQNSIKTLNLEGFEDYSIYNEKEYFSNDNIKENWTILPLTNPRGSFTPERRNNKKQGVHNISNVQADRTSNNFQVCIAINLSSLPLSETYKLDTNNYTINNSEFSFDCITKLNGDEYLYHGVPIKINPNDKSLVDAIKPTHLIFVTSSKKALSRIKIDLKRKISNVLIKTNSDNENDLKDLKTYGFKNFTNAIKASFKKYDETEAYFPIEVKIENKKGGYSWLAITLSIIVVVIIFVALKKK
jgi:hypothetical protein